MKRFLLFLILAGAAGAQTPTPTPSPPTTTSIANVPFFVFNPNADTILGWDNTDKTYRPFYLGSGLTYTHGGTTPFTLSAVTGGSLTPPVTLTLNTLGAATSDALSLVNTTAATSSVSQYSPDIRWQGQGWKTAATAASQTVEWRAWVLPANDTTAPENFLVLDSRTNGASGTWISRVYFWDGEPGAWGSWVIADSFKIGGTAGKGRMEFGTQSSAPVTPTATNNVVVYSSSTGDLMAKQSTGTVTNLTGSIPETRLSFTDVTTNNASTSAHGFLPKLDGNTAHFLNGNGAWATPAGGVTTPTGTGFWHNTTAATLDTAALAETGSGGPGVRATNPTVTDLVVNQTTDGDTALFSTRRNDSSPTGNFLRFDRFDHTDGHTNPAQPLFQIGVYGGINDNLQQDGMTGLTIRRFTNSAPTGNFEDFQNASAASVWTVDITGSLAAGTVPAARVTGLAIGTDVQAYDPDLTTWAGITPATGVGTFLATPSSANLRAALTDENGTGAALFSGATTPDFTTGITIGGAAASRKVLVGDGTKFAASTETYATPGTSGNLMTSDGTNWTSAAPVVSATSTTTFTNKRVTPRVTTISSSFGTPTFNTDNCDALTLTGISATITNMSTNMTGTPNNFDKLIVRLKDDGTARGITWGNSFKSSGATLPTTTVVNKVTTVGFIWDPVRLNGASAAGVWSCVATDQEP